MSKAPTPVADAQLEELGIGVKEYDLTRVNNVLKQMEKEEWII